MYANYDITPLVQVPLDNVMQPYFITLVRQDGNPLNPTPWAIDGLLFNRDGTLLEDRCA
ncbi:hypothetical protein BH24ACT3_BH24ACT3_08480 [soil metagenome]